MPVQIVYVTAWRQKYINKKKIESIKMLLSVSLFLRPVKPHQLNELSLPVDVGCDFLVGSTGEGLI